MAIIITIIVLLILCLLSYFIGNLVLDTFDEHISTKLMNSGFGFLILCVFFAFIGLGYAIYHLILNNIK